MSKKPPKWIDVYPQGTKEGDEEQSFFIALSRNRWDWMSTTNIARYSKLTVERVEELLDKYARMKIVINNPENEEQWGYWERVPEFIKDEMPLVEEDRKRRIKKYLKKESSQ